MKDKDPFSCFFEVTSEHSGEEDIIDNIGEFLTTHVDTSYDLKVEDALAIQKHFAALGRKIDAPRGTKPVISILAEVVANHINREKICCSSELKKFIIETMVCINSDAFANKEQEWYIRNHAFYSDVPTLNSFRG